MEEGEFTMESSIMERVRKFIERVRKFIERVRKFIIGIIPTICYVWCGIVAAFVIGLIILGLIKYAAAMTKQGPYGICGGMLEVRGGLELEGKKLKYQGTMTSNRKEQYMQIFVHPETKEWAVMLADYGQGVACIKTWGKDWGRKGDAKT